MPGVGVGVVSVGGSCGVWGSAVESGLRVCVSLWGVVVSCMLCCGGVGWWGGVGCVGWGCCWCVSVVSSCWGVLGGSGWWSEGVGGVGGVLPVTGCVGFGWSGSVNAGGT